MTHGCGRVVLTTLGDELIAMAQHDLRMREELIAEGSLFGEYHPRMREVHERNAARLMQILQEHGWPGRSLVGESAAEAAWLILQHAIGNPELQRLGLSLLKGAAAAKEVPWVHVVTLEDRIRCNEGRAQRYGTQFDWDEFGHLSPCPIEDEESVDARRAEIGLVPLAEEIRRQRDVATLNGEQPPTDWNAYQRQKQEWLCSTGWRE
jgi:Family of unknown function (DUF6624)